MTASLEERVLELERRVAALEAPAETVAASQATRKPSPREFHLEKSPKTDNDKTLVAGYYLELIRGLESFDFDDIETYYRQAKEAPPENRRDPPYQNVKRGYFRRAGKTQQGKAARNRWSMTNTGIARVEQGFQVKK
jgi:hypothetical protein